MAREEMGQEVCYDEQAVTLENILGAVKRMEQTDAKSRLSVGFWAES